MRARRNIRRAVADWLDDSRLAAVSAFEVLTQKYRKLEDRYERLRKLVIKQDEHLGAILRLQIDGEPEWTAEDALALAKFLGSNSGRALVRRMRAVATETAAAACGAREHTVHAAGTAHGWDEAFQWLISISRVSGARETQNNEQSDEGERELVERLSP